MSTSRRDARICWICLQSEDDDVEPKDWVRPCKCRGSTAYAHQECLRQWIQAKRDGDLQMIVSCPSCKTPYRIRQPPTPHHVKIAHSFANLWAVLPKLLGVVAIGYACWIMLEVYGKLALGTILGKEGLEKIVTKTILYEPEWSLSTYARSFSIFLTCMLFTPLDIMALLACVATCSAMPGLYAVVSVLLVAMDVPSWIYRKLLLVYHFFYPKTSIELKTEEDRIAQQEESTYLRRLARSTTFPNALVHASKSQISCISFVLKIFLLDHNVEHILPPGALPPPPRRAGQKQRTLFVEYERGNILLTALRAKYFRQRAPVRRVSTPELPDPRRRRIRRRVQAEDNDSRPMSPEIAQVMRPFEPIEQERSLSPPRMDPDDQRAAEEEYKVIMMRRPPQISDPRLPAFLGASATRIATPPVRRISTEERPVSTDGTPTRPEADSGLNLRRVTSLSDLRAPRQAPPTPAPLPRETFLTIDINTVKTHMYYLISHTLLLPFILGYVAEWVVVPITMLLLPFFTNSTGGIGMWLFGFGVKIVKERGIRVAVAGLGYGMCREMAVRWWRRRIHLESSSIHVEDYE